MFANIFFSKKQMSAFKSSYTSGIESQSHISFLKAYILNDDAKPPKTLIGFRIYYVPVGDVKSDKPHSEKYEREAFVGLLPEEAFKLGKLIDKLLLEVTKENNYKK